MEHNKLEKERSKIMTIQPRWTLPFLLLLMIAGYNDVKITIICLFVIGLIFMIYLEQHIIGDSDIITEK